MPTPRLVFGPIDSLSPRERQTLETLWRHAEVSTHPMRDEFLSRIALGVTRVEQIAEALEAYPPIFQERQLGSRERSLGTLVDHLGQADDSNYEMFVPTRAIVGRALVVAELNFWRMIGYLVGEIAGRAGDEAARAELELVQKDVDEWLHGCVYTLLAEEVLGSIARDQEQPQELRTCAVEKLAGIWGNYLHWAVRDFFPLLQATWSARRRIRVSIGTTLGVSEMMRLLQAGCDPEFVEYFARPNPTRDEARAFQEFLIGVPTEAIRSLVQLMEEEGRTCMSPEEAREALGIVTPENDTGHGGVRAYRFFRERQLQAAARRLRNEPGPRRTAEEYVMLYFLEKECAEKGAGAS
ncbi:MAG: hypothetical protein CMJ94_13160 [Planctomycetes bacterium]|nr:hypothetical protein [Planctomycetota bacterium]